jgi:hypothetical protein
MFKNSGSDLTHHLCTLVPRYMPQQKINCEDLEICKIKSIDSHDFKFLVSKNFPRLFSDAVYLKFSLRKLNLLNYFPAVFPEDFPLMAVCQFLIIQYFQGNEKYC